MSRISQDVAMLGGLPFLMARIVGGDGKLLTSAQVEAVSYHVYNVETLKGRGHGTVSVSQALSDVLETDHWTADGPGYNFAHEFKAGIFGTESGSDFAVEHAVELNGGDVINVTFDVSMVSLAERFPNEIMAWLIPLLNDERMYRQLAAQLVPSYSGPRDNSTIAALVCKHCNLQPTEFKAMKASERSAFVAIAIAEAQKTEFDDGKPPNGEHDDGLLLDEILAKLGRKWRLVKFLRYMWNLPISPDGLRIASYHDLIDKAWNDKLAKDDTVEEATIRATANRLNCWLHDNGYGDVEIIAEGESVTLRR